MIINLINKNLMKILLFLAISPGSKYSRKEIKEKTEMNNLPLDLSLIELINFKLINQKNKLYYINLENQIVKQLLEEIKELKTLPLKIQFILLDFISNTVKLRGIENIILFGSYSKLIYSEKSDIDIAVITKKLDETTNKKISKIANKLSKKYKKEIQEHFFTQEDLQHKKDHLIKDVLKNGKVLI